MSIITSIKSIFSNSALAKVILRAALSKAEDAAAAQIATFVVAHGGTVSTTEAKTLLSVLVSTIEDKIG